MTRIKEFGTSREQGFIALQRESGRARATCGIA